MISSLRTNSIFIKVAFFSMILIILVFNLSAGSSLALGLLIGLLLKNPFPAQSKKITKYLLQFSIVGLGFGMNIHQVAAAGRDGFVFTLLTIGFAMGIGFMLGRLLKVNHIISYLISCGTAICGGSAIAAVSQVLKTDDKEISVSIGTVFILNAIALFIFPPIGHYFHLTQQQFGIWSAIAIHDTSSVVGASAKYGNEALMVATTVKLARALWIVPLVLLTSFLFKKQGSAWNLPWFILFFVIASVLSTYLHFPESLNNMVVHIAKIGFSITLFLIGCSISVDSIRKVGVRAIVLGLTLWVIILVSTLMIVINY